MVYLHAVEIDNGVGIGWTHVTDDLIKIGRLRLASDRKVGTDRGYHACIPAQAQDKPEAHAFLEWIAGLCDESRERLSAGRLDTGTHGREIFG